jgi:predicted transcriptional regulator
MSKTAVVTARIDPETLSGLDKLAGYHERSRAWLVAKAVEQYVRDESAFIAFIKEGEDAIARGDYITHDELISRIKARHEGKRAA